MKSKRTLITLITLLFCLLFISCEIDEETDNKKPTISSTSYALRSIRGSITVENSNTGEPINGAYISVSYKNHQSSKNSIGDGTAEFVIRTSGYLENFDHYNELAKGVNLNIQITHPNYKTVNSTILADYIEYATYNISNNHRTDEYIIYFARKIFLVPSQ
jgi:hypothetical protein